VRVVLCLSLVRYVELRSVCSLAVTNSSTSIYDTNSMLTKRFTRSEHIYS
jgi:hypothetical protein